MAGQTIHDLAPGIGNPRNSEGAFIKTKSGGILFSTQPMKGIPF